MHVVVALAPLRDELRNKFWRILPIGIQDQYCARVHLVQAGRQRQFLAEVARQAQQGNRSVFTCQALHDFPGAIGTAVIHIEHPALHAIQPLEHGSNAWMQGRKRLRFVARRHQHSQDFGRACAIQSNVSR